MTMETFHLGGIWSKVKSEYAAIADILGPIRLSRSDMIRLAFRKAVHDITMAWSDAAVGYQFVSLGLAIMIAILIIDNAAGRFSSLSRRGIPILKRPKGVHRRDYESILKEGKRKYPSTPYIITYSGYEYVVFPSSSFDEVKRLSAQRASLIEWATHVFFQGWRFLGADNSVLHKTIATDLSRAVPSMVPVRQKSVVQAINAAVGACPEWKSVRLYGTVQNIVTRSNAAAFMTSEFANNAWWLHAVELLPMISMMAVLACHSTPRFFRPLVASIVFFPAWCVYWAMEIMIRPKIRRELEDIQGSASKRQGHWNQEAPDDAFPITSWLMARYPPSPQNARQIGRDYINIAFESTSATSATVYFILSELATRPELVRELREEITPTLIDGVFPMTNLNEWRKLDSVMRESSRINAFSYLGLHRRVMKPVQLSIGPELPAGTLLCVDAYNLTMSEELWKEPHEFHPMRFLKLRQQPGEETRHQFTSVGAGVPGFGDGPQACPGRWYAGNTIKLILAHLILNYEIKLDPLARKPKRHSMPNASFAPDMFARICIKELQL